MTRVPFKSNDNVFGNLSISLKDVMNARQNLKPLIDICFAANQVHSKFRTTFQGCSPQEASELEQILGCGIGGDRNKWEEYFRGAVFTVSLIISRQCIHPFFYIRVGRDQELIARYARGVGGDDGRERLVEEWELRAELCFPALRRGTRIYTLGAAKTGAGGAGVVG